MEFEKSKAGFEISGQNKVGYAFGVLRFGRWSRRRRGRRRRGWPVATVFSGMVGRENDDGDDEEVAEQLEC